MTEAKRNPIEVLLVPLSRAPMCMSGGVAFTSNEVLETNDARDYPHHMV